MAYIYMLYKTVQEGLLLPSSFLDVYVLLHVHVRHYKSIMILIQSPRPSLLNKVFPQRLQ